MWRKYNEAAVDKSVHGGRVVLPDILEVSYAELTTCPERTLRSIYAHANIQWTDQSTRHFAAEVDALQSYQVNRHRTLPTPLRRRIQDMAQEYMDALGYTTAPSPGD
ncbi:hypothetical protein DYB28_013698 [Aphanomyces astaci]|nr:hypothetical protein DYB26_015835 [Aphanomyces astaci]RLO02813.1 hypothetical protein DYB28_013698 [Aphanomyces astaci]